VLGVTFCTRGTRASSYPTVTVYQIPMSCDKSFAIETHTTHALRMLDSYTHHHQISNPLSHNPYIKLSPPLPQFVDP
jgi:hypothetical protein